VQRRMHQFADLGAVLGDVGGNIRVAGLGHVLLRLGGVRLAARFK
jgi:hypothetical protein